jgi:putative copper resistance protein D
VIGLLFHGDVGTSAGYDGPPPPTVDRLLGHWSFELGPALLCSVAIGLYLFGVWRLHRRGDRWSVGRIAAWLSGWVVVAYALLGGLAAYDDVLFSTHAVQHMLLATVAPVFLALGAPITLALRTLPRRPRKALLWLLHTPVARVLSFPLVGFIVLTVSLYALYYSSLFQISLEHQSVHYLLHVHFLLAGCLFYWPIIGVDPLPGRLPHWARLIVLFISFPVHALLGLSIMSTAQPFAAKYFAAVARPWGATVLSDQHTGGAIMWASGELVGAIVFIALFVQWSRADEREAIRTDRRLDRAESAQQRAEMVERMRLREEQEQAELDAYNARLAALAAGTVPARPSAPAVPAQTSKD